MSKTSSWFSSLVAAIEAEAVAIEPTIIAVAEAIGAAVLPFGEEFLQKIASFALEAVLSNATKAISGQEKFGSAVTHVIQSVEAQGKTLAVNDAQAAVQAAYHAARARI